MAEQMNLGATLVFLTRTNDKQTLINVDSVCRFDEEGEGSSVVFKEQIIPTLVKENPLMIRRLITTAKKNEIKEVMGQMVEAQKELMKGLGDMLPPELGGKDPFEPPYGDDPKD